MLVKKEIKEIKSKFSFKKTVFTTKTVNNQELVLNNSVDFKLLNECKKSFLKLMNRIIWIFLTGNVFPYAT